MWISFGDGGVESHCGPRGFCQDPPIMGEEVELLHGFSRCLCATAPMLKHDKHPLPADIGSFACPSPYLFYPADMEWVLRNLTTHEFVRPSAVALSPDYIHGPFIELMGYGEVILIKTSRLRFEHTGIQVLTVDVNKGPWAGHRLDIVPAAYIDGGDPWRDISDEIAREIETIWRFQLGNHWRVFLMEL